MGNWFGNKKSCKFCYIINKQKEKILYEDSEIACFNARSKGHILCCTKECIPTINDLPKNKEIDIIKKLKF